VKLICILVGLGSLALMLVLVVTVLVGASSRGTRSADIAEEEAA
jgi:hypothetical protein